MILCAAGDAHGALDHLYAEVRAFEAALNVVFEYVLHVGDFGIWPEPARVDRATLKHDGAGDFPAWHLARLPVPRPTVFIKGNHEDFVWLDALPNDEPLPGLRYLRNGHQIILGDALLVGGIGGCYGPSDLRRPARLLQGRARRHYTKDELDTLAAGGPVDVLLLHDAPAGIAFDKRFPSGAPRRYQSEAAGLAELVERVRPSVCFFGHHHTRVDAHIAGVHCIGLNAVPWPGCLVAVELEPGGQARLLGEWPAGGGAPVQKS